jgi:adenylate cyclase
MSTRNSGSLTAGAVALIVLIAMAALMTLNPAGVTAALRGLQFAAFDRIAGGTGAAPPSGDLAALYTSNFETGVWASNASALWPQLLFLLIAGCLLVLLIARLRPVWAGLFTVFAIVVAFAGSWLLFERQHLFIAALSPSIALAIPFLFGALVSNAMAPRRPVRFTTETPPEAASAAVAPVISRPRAQAQSRTVTYLAGRMRGISLGDGVDANGVQTLLDGTFAPVFEAVANQKGCVAYASGGRFAAVWNAAGDDPDHASHACEAALRMMNSITQMKDSHGEGTPYDALQIGIGIATGPAVASTLEGHDGYSVSGECTDIADLLSELSTRYGPTIIVGESARNAAEKNFALLEVDTIALGPGGEPAKVYALYGNPLVRASPKFRALSSFHDHLFQAIRAQRWNDARTLIDQCNNLSGAIPQLYRLHLARVGWYETNPPPADWDGAFRPPIL